jgi:hypothetical protein
MKAKTIINAYILSRAIQVAATVNDDAKLYERRLRLSRKLLLKLLDICKEYDRLTHPEWY